MKRRSRLLGLLAAAVMATVAALVPAGAAHADYFVNYRQVVNTGSLKCLEALGVDRNSPVGQRSCTGYSVQTWGLLYPGSLQALPPGVFALL